MSDSLTFNKRLTYGCKVMIENVHIIGFFLLILYYTIIVFIVRSMLDIKLSMQELDVELNFAGE